MKNLLVIFLMGAVAACGGDDGTETTPTDNPTPEEGVYEPFKASNFESQQVRVGAYDAIYAIRKGDTFTADSFGGSCDTFSPDVKAPSDPSVIASNYVESAGLSGKVEGRKDDHAYNDGAEVGKDLHAWICGAIEAGSQVDAATEKNAVEGIGWQAQVVDKTLQHFFYLSVYHEMVRYGPKYWDEAFGYYGMTTDGSDAGGIAATAKSRDGNCGTTYSTDIFNKFAEGKVLLAAALDAEGKTGNEDAPDNVPQELKDVVADIDSQLLEVFALSFGRELMGIDAGDKPVIKLIEARSFFRILKPAIADHDAKNSTTFVADLEPTYEGTDPDAVDTAAGYAMLDAVWGLDVRTLCN